MSGMPSFLPIAATEPAAASTALVVFCDVASCSSPGLRWLRWLRPGFRHVFVAVRDGSHWITLDPLSPHTEVVVQPIAVDFDLAGWFRARGLTVVPTTLFRGHAGPAPIALFTCVEAVKRVLGLHAPFIVTPYQLYRHLAGQTKMECPDGASPFLA